MKLINYLSVAILLSFLGSSAANATESVDCSGKTYSISIVINLSDHSFGGYQVYKDNAMIINGWAKKDPIINISKRHISFRAFDKKNKNITFSTKNNKPGKLKINNEEHSVTCEWEAF